ncbi:gamma-glutamyltransferase [Lacihabitans soyangensis]|uniref:Glutathione hydrolase proenzyme n=1 Tax=Lacihabitans soyangensis TaxID=869394 RepID=A0AAE3H193_9BACT|nr:gamma-glutamyltransferase [Lacihabitans soyangensis]MCP9763048.1 gamma-glutamyltransferase [Lacihabitans soyangensis]
MKNRIAFFFLALFLVLACKTTQKTPTKEASKDLFSLFVEDPNVKPFYSEKKGVFAKNGMVAAAHAEASNAGIEILKMGGNAIDAAVATHFALAVVFPFAGNLGGGGFAVIRTKNGQAHTLDFREKAPLKAHRDMYLDAEGNVIQGLSLQGHLASGVPGSVDGMVEMHEKFGKLPWAKLLEPAIKLAEEGVILTDREALGLNNNADVFKKVNGQDLQYFMKPQGTKWAKGDLLVQKDLAETLKLIQLNKRAGFYEGNVAKLLVDEMAKGGGIISQEDLQKYHSAWRKPIEADYKNYKIITMPPSSSGGVALLQMLRHVEPYPLQKWGWNSANTAQVMIEAERRVYADRAKWMGDTDFIDVPIEKLISRDYLKKRWIDFDSTKASNSKDIKGGTLPGYESFETTHYSVVDSEGNAVSITTTLNGAYGSKVIVAGGGFLMNNEMDDFSIKSGVPNMFGLLGSKANEIQPEKRMLSSMTPTIVEKDGKLFMVVGTPGGSTIMTSVYQTILNVTEHKMTMQQAVNALKFHHQWLPDRTVFEANAFSEKTLEKLRGKGYIMDQQKGTLGRMDCIMVHPDGKLEGASDPRADNTSIGY